MANPQSLDGPSEENCQVLPGSKSTTTNNSPYEGEAIYENEHEERRELEEEVILKPDDQDQQEEDPRGKELFELRQKAMVSRRCSYWEDNMNMNTSTCVDNGSQKSATLSNNNTYPVPQPEIAPPPPPPKPMRGDQPRSINSLPSPYCTPVYNNSHKSGESNWSLRPHSFCCHNKNITNSCYGMLPKNGSFSCTSSPSPLRRDARLVFQEVITDNIHNNNNNNNDWLQDRHESFGAATRSRRPETKPPPTLQRTTANQQSHQFRSRSHNVPSNGSKYNRVPRPFIGQSLQHRVPVAEKPNHLQSTASTADHSPPAQTIPHCCLASCAATIPTDASSSATVPYSQPRNIITTKASLPKLLQSSSSPPSEGKTIIAVPSAAGSPSTAALTLTIERQQQPENYQQPPSSPTTLFHRHFIPPSPVENNNNNNTMSCSFSGQTAASSLLNSDSKNSNNMKVPIAMEVPIERSYLPSSRLPTYQTPTVTLLKTMRQKRDRTPDLSQLLLQKSTSDFFQTAINNNEPLQQQSQPPLPMQVLSQSRSTPLLAARALEVIDNFADNNNNNNNKPSDRVFQVPIIQEPVIEPKQRQQQQYSNQQENNSNRSGPVSTFLPFQVPLSTASPPSKKKDAASSFDASLNNNRHQLSNNNFSTSNNNNNNNTEDQRNRLRDRLAQLISELHQLDTSTSSLTTSYSFSGTDKNCKFPYRGSRTAPVSFLNLVSPTDDNMSSKTIFPSPVLNSTSDDFSFSSHHNSRRSAYDTWSQTPNQQQPFRISSLAARGQRDSSFGHHLNSNNNNNNNSINANGFGRGKSVHWDNEVKVAGGEDNNNNNNASNNTIITTNRPPLLYSPRPIEEFEPGNSSIVDIEAIASASRAAAAASSSSSKNQLLGESSSAANSNGNIIINNNNNSEDLISACQRSAGPQPTPVIVLVAEKQKAGADFTSTFTDVPQPFKSYSQSEASKTPVIGATFAATSSPPPFTSARNNVVLPPGREDYVRVQQGGEVPEFGFRRPCNSTALAPTSPVVSNCRISSGFFSSNGSKASKAPSTPNSPSLSAFFGGTPAQISRQQRFGSVRVQNARPNSAVVGNNNNNVRETARGRFFSTANSEDSAVYLPLPPPDTPADVAKRKVFLEHATDEIRRRKASQSAAETASRRHNDFLLPGQKTLLPSRSQLASMSMPASPVLKHGGGPFVGRACRDFVAVTFNELSLRHGDIVQVVRRINQNWLEGYLKNDLTRRLGIFPVTHVKPLPKERDSILAEARFDFAAEAPFELSFAKGDLIAVHRRVDEKWYEGRLGLAAGIFPASYVRLLNDSPASFFGSTENNATPLSSSSSLSVSNTATPLITSPSPVFSPIQFRPACPQRQCFTPQPFAKNDQTIRTAPPGRPESVATPPQRMTTSDDRTIEARKQWFLERTADANGSAIALADLQWERYEVIFDYDPHVGDELLLRRGDVIQVIDDIATTDYSYRRRMVLARKENGEIGVCPYDCLRRL